MFNWWSIEKFNLSWLKTVYIIFITFPTVPMFSYLNIEHRKKIISILYLFFLFPLYLWDTDISWFKQTKKQTNSWNRLCDFFLQATWDLNFLYHITSSGKEKWATVIIEAITKTLARGDRVGWGWWKSLKFDGDSLQVLWRILPKICLNKKILSLLVLP